MEEFVQLSFKTKNAILAKLAEDYQFDNGDPGYFAQELKVEGDEVSFVDSCWNNKVLYNWTSINRELIPDGSSFSAWLIGVFEKFKYIPSDLVSSIRENDDEIDKNELTTTIQYYGANPESYTDCWYYEETRQKGSSVICYVDAQIWDEWVSRYNGKEKVFADYDKNDYPIWLRILEGLFSDTNPHTNKEYREREMLFKYGKKEKAISVKQTNNQENKKAKAGEAVAEIIDVYKLGPSYLIAVSLFCTVSKGDTLSSVDKSGNVFRFTVDHIETTRKILDSAGPGSGEMIALAIRDCESRPVKGNKIFAT